MKCQHTPHRLAVAHGVTARNTSNSAMRIVLSGGDPMCFEPTSANNAVAVYETATPNDISSPINISGAKIEIVYLCDSINTSNVSMNHCLYQTEQDFRNDTPKKWYDGFDAGIHTVYVGEVIGAWKR